MHKPAYVHACQDGGSWKCKVSCKNTLAAFEPGALQAHAPRCKPVQQATGHAQALTITTCKHCSRKAAQQTTRQTTHRSVWVSHLVRLLLWAAARAEATMAAAEVAAGGEGLLGWKSTGAPGLRGSGCDLWFCSAAILHQGTPQP